MRKHPVRQPKKAFTSQEHQRLGALLDVAAMALQEVGVRLSLVSGLKDPPVRLLGELSVPNGCLNAIRTVLHGLPTHVPLPSEDSATPDDEWVCRLSPDMRAWLTLKRPFVEIPFCARFAPETGSPIEIECCGVPYPLDPLGIAAFPQGTRGPLPTPDAGVIALFSHWQLAHDASWQQCITTLWRMPMVARVLGNRLERKSIPAIGGHYY
jgi:hypothetical protein